MKKLFVLLISLILTLSAFAGCNNPEDTESGSNAESSSSSSGYETDEIIEGSIVTPEGYLPLEVNNEKTGNTEGYGCQIDTHIFKETNGNFYTEEDWTEWLARIDDMNLQSVRTQVFPEWYERGNDNNDPDVFDKNSPNVDFNSIEMQQLYRLLDICEERDIKVDLSFYGCNRIYTSQDGKVSGSWLANSFQGNWITAPKLVDEEGKAYPGYEEYAESVSALLDHIVNVKKYTCVYEFSLYPEPNGSFFNADGRCVDAEYVEFYNVVYRKLRKDGVWGKIICSGPGDCANDINRYHNYINNLKDVFGKNTSSVYKFNNESSNLEMYDYARANVNECSAVGNTWGVCESGTNRFVDPANQSDIDTYDRAVFLARMVINYTNAGCTNIKYWVLNDVYYDGYVMRLGLWKLANDKFKAEARPQFYSWSMITKFTDFGSEIYPVTSGDGDVCAVAYRLPEGGWSYLIANSGTSLKKVSVVSRHTSSQRVMNVYELSGSTVPSTNRTITSNKTAEMKGGALNITLRSNSFTVITTR